LNPMSVSSSLGGVVDVAMGKRRREARKKWYKRFQKSVVRENEASRGERKELLGRREPNAKRGKKQEKKL